jgi:hypothetical protein
MKKIATVVVFIGGALASIASSDSTPWVVAEVSPVEPVTVSGGTTVAFGITTEMSGPIGSDGGRITARLTLAAETGAVVQAALISGPNNASQFFVFDGTALAVEVNLEVPVCELTCESDVRLEIMNINDRDPPVEVSGEIEAAIEGRGHPFPDDFAVTLDVTPLGEISE